MNAKKIAKEMYSKAKEDLPSYYCSRLENMIANYVYSLLGFGVEYYNDSRFVKVKVARLKSVGIVFELRIEDYCRFCDDFAKYFGVYSKVKISKFILVISDFNNYLWINDKRTDAPDMAIKLFNDIKEIVNEYAKFAKI